MLMKRLVTLGLGIVLSGSLLIPVNALASTNTCQIKSQGQVKERRVNYKKYRSGSYSKSYRPYTQEQMLEKLNTYMEKLEKAYEKGSIDEDIYDRIQEFLIEKIERLENDNIDTPPSDPDTGNETPTPDPDTGDETPAPDSDANQDISAEEQQMVDLVNKARRENGVKPLIVDTKLTELARMKSKDMIDNNYFSHNSPTYGSPFDMLKDFGVSYSRAGENIAGNQSVERAHESLMNSPGHRQNILSPNYTHIGIGIQEGGRYGTMFTQLFIKK